MSREKMDDHFSNLIELIKVDFQNHAESVARYVNCDREFEDAIQEGVETVIGQVHNMPIWTELLNIYSEILTNKIACRTD